ncbi:MurR/RpiR family transcriptional regulator [Williamsia sp. CHRR-6]|uniref:MurR/RpiR family transcriptional regulator n=1 Tax=Williamsia sp. CHRR-6 TaxID=2835871 RepID=UPI001BDA9961|nr:MurR/RpiR family transcriptional regulator [Williamsia sp. CHRR-6]MBT0566454.1 MurR/RpiR family transcriptional regulator [Williamsia sp. CHRR-6]
MAEVTADRHWAPGELIAHIRALLPSLLPAERAVATVMLESASRVIDMSAQQVAEQAGASRATVVRTCQSFGLRGYQQLRVLLARDADTITPAVPPPAGPAATVHALFDHAATSMAGMSALLDDDAITAAVTLLSTASTVVVVGNGLSYSLALDFATRLMSRGVRAMAPADVITQQITAGTLGAGDAVVVISGSGATRPSLRAAELARHGGATVIGVTSFSRSALAHASDVTLVVGMADFSFRDEVAITSRIPHAIVLEGLIAAITAERGPAAAQRYSRNLAVISDHLADGFD